MASTKTFTTGQERPMKPNDRHIMNWTCDSAAEWMFRAAEHNKLIWDKYGPKDNAVFER